LRHDELEAEIATKVKTWLFLASRLIAYITQNPPKPKELQKIRKTQNPKELIKESWKIEDQSSCSFKMQKNW
jgi:hypothetical protein